MLEAGELRGVLAPRGQEAGRLDEPRPTADSVPTQNPTSAENDDELRLAVEELSASRARLVAAADAERRGVERELHDGPQQHLIGLAVNLQLARRLADTDPSGLKPLLESMSRDVQEALDHVRRLGVRVYPPVLPDRGLVEALQTAAEPSVTTRVEASPALDRFTPEIEAAVYFCCVEALERLHAPERATIRLSREPDALVFVVTAETGSDAWADDDLVAIGDRLGAVGGKLTSTAPPAGRASISGTVPLGRRP